MQKKLPRKVTVQDQIATRYPDNRRPLSWDKRVEGIDVVRSTDGEELRLLSDGGQSPAQPHWEILLIGGDAASGYRWTLYGLPPEVRAN